MITDNLYDKVGISVLKTELTRKITLDGETSVLPVYKIKLSELFYNDKNDRIATSIDSYNRTHKTPLIPGKNEQYNQVIENFIVESNEQAIFKTKNNIRLVGQREAGVVLPDGRVIDGNRRFTCLRQLSSEAEKFTYFEAIILPKEANEKQIKLLELMIQHGEEQRVEYDPIDMIVGMYHDIKETGMLTIAEYAKAIDVPEHEIELKLKMADTFVDFLEFINLPKHWYLIKEFNIYAAVNGTGHSTNLESIIRRCDEKYRDDLKKILYVNIILETQSKIIEIVSKLITSDLIVPYIRHTRDLANNFKEQLDTIEYSNFDELKTIIRMNSDIKQELTQLLDESLLKHKKNEVHSQPSKNVSKAVSMMKTIDSGVIDRLTEKETVELKQNLTKLSEYVNQYTNALGLSPTQNVDTVQNPNECIDLSKNKAIYSINIEKLVPPITVNNRIIKSLIETIQVNAEEECLIYFVDKVGNKISNEYRLVPGINSINFELNASISSANRCYLVVKHIEASDDEISQIIPFDVKMIFASKFDF